MHASNVVWGGGGGGGGGGAGPSYYCAAEHMHRRHNYMLSLELNLEKNSIFSSEFVNRTVQAIHTAVSCLSILRLFQLRQRQNLCPIQYIFLYSSCDRAQSHLNVQGSGRRQSTSGSLDKDRESGKCRKLP